MPSAAEEEEAFRWFCSVRWGDTGGKPACPACGGMEHYFIRKRRKFRCKDCSRDFTPTSGTEWHSRKLSYVKVREIMLDIIENDRSSLKLAERHGINQRAAWYIKKRYREGAKRT